jgi:hypothetical protein
VVGDLHAGDLAALEGLAEHDGPDEARMVGDERLQLALEVLVGAVLGAAARQRGVADRGGVRGVGAARPRVGALQVGDPRTERQAGRLQLGELRGPGHEHVGPAGAAVVGDVEAEALERLELRGRAVHALQARGAGRQRRRLDVGEPPPQARGARGAVAAAGDRGDALAGRDPRLAELRAAEPAAGGQLATGGRVAQDEVPVALAGEAGAQVSGHRRAVGGARLTGPRRAAERLAHGRQEGGGGDG